MTDAHAKPLDEARLGSVFRILLDAYGPQRWWPGDTPFEIMVGAILTQSTAWTNVESGLARLCERVPLAAEDILSLPLDELAASLRPVGYFNIKSRRLQAFCRAFLEAGGLARLRSLETDALRGFLLGIPGVGPETADDMLLYAFERPVFVVDAYTRRIFARLGMLAGSEGYEAIRRGFETALGPNVALFNEYHALIVRHGKAICRPRPLCDRCCLRGSCQFPGS